MEPIPTSPPTLNAGDRVTLHPALASDAPELYALIERNRERLRQWLPWATLAYGLDDCRTFLDLCERENAARQSLALLIRASGVLCGSVALHRIDPRSRGTSLGYWLDVGYEGHGIVTRACRTLITEAFRSYDLHRIEIRCATGNHRSAAVPLHLGFSEEGILREAEWVCDRWVDLRVFSMLQPDWRVPE